MLRSLAPVLALATLSASAAWAQSVPPLATRSGLLDIYQQAAINNADLAAARAQYQARREVVPQARAGLLPFLGASAELTDTRTEFDTDSGSRSLSRSGSAYPPASASRCSAPIAGSSSRRRRRSASRRRCSCRSPNRS